tara:strand:- start:122 stop:388 length:267 start_codon:yes stop_codon:yes gene_type:complete
MSKLEISASVSELVEFMKERTISNLVESKNRGDYEIDDASFQTVCALIDSSLAHGFSAGYQNIDRAVRSFEKNLSKDVKTKSRTRSKS